MEMRTSSPWWFSAIFLGALAFVFLGERAFADISGMRWIFSGVGVLAAVGITVLRAWTYGKSSGQRRVVERALLLCQAGGLFALLLYLLTTDFGQGLLGLDDAAAKSKQRFETSIQVLYAIIATASMIPMVMIETSLGIAGRTQFDFRAPESDFDDAAVDSFRVSSMASAGLTIALATGFLFMTCNVTEQRNIRKDYSYFKTSSPGSATRNVVKSEVPKLRVILFFPEVNEVKEEVRGYFESLADATGKVEIQYADHEVEPVLAKKYRVRDNGTVVLVKITQERDPKTKEMVEKDDKFESFTINTDIKRARRRELRRLDSKVYGSINKLALKKRVAYMTVGHGEINDPASVGPRGVADPRLKASIVKQILGILNFQVKDLGITSDIPDDAALVLVLGPRTPLADVELAALDRYLAQGGSALIALDPRSSATLGVLEGRLGVTFNANQLVDDKDFLVQRGNIADRIFLRTNQFSSHASVTTLSRYRSKTRLPLVQSGYLEDARFTVGDGKAKKPKRTYVIHSMGTTFADPNRNFSFDKGEEKKQRYNIAAAIEDPTAKPDNADDKHKGMRAMVIADADVFIDLIQGQIALSQAFFGDAVKWLAGQEHLAGKVESEEDKPIKHTNKEQVVWFYATIVGAPLLVLLMGLSTLWRRRRRTERGRKQS